MPDIQKKHLENMTETIVNIPSKNPNKRIVEKNFIISDTKLEHLCYFTDRILKGAYDITIDNHHCHHASSKRAIVSKFYNNGIDKLHNLKIIGRNR